MICDVKDYQLLQSKLTELRPHHTETVWEEVGDLIVDWGEKQYQEGGRFHLQTLEKGGPNPFEIINLLDFVMQVYEFAGESALSKKFGYQFQLANVYSDQAGLSRKFELYETLIEESYPRIEKREGDDEMHYYFTRSLKRLAQLTEDWKGGEESIQLWTRLAEYGLESSDEERMSILKEIEEKAPWFAYANPELFNDIG
jgi:hypothetical protein